MDFETTHHSKGSALDPKNRLVLACWEFKGERKSTRCDYSILDLFADIELADFIVAHNAKFEIQWLRKMGYNGDLLVYDTLLAEYVCAGNRKVPLGLDEVSKKYGGKGKNNEVQKLIHEGVCPSTIDPILLETYCHGDVEETTRVFLKQREILRELGLLPTLYTRCLLTPVLAEMESRGLALDRRKILEEYTDFSGRLADLKRELDKFTGGINLNSPKQLGIFLYETLGFSELKDRGGKPKRNTPTGKNTEGSRLTDSDTIFALHPRTRMQRDFTGLYKGYGSLKVNTKALEKLWACCESYPLDEVPILYGTINQSVTTTHRTSSSGREFKLQFQNFNRKFKPLFGVRSPGWKLGEADGAQLEFRVAAHLGRDAVAAADIRDPEFDAHIQTLSIRLNKKWDPKFYKELFERYKAGDKEVKLQRADNDLTKGHTFKPLYGGMSGTDDEVAYYKFFQQKYKSIFDTQTAWTHTVAREKKLVTETGLIFYWPHCKVSSYGYVSDRTSIFNYPVQSLATADIIPINLVFAYYRMRSMGMRSFLTNTVHDAVIGEVHPDEQELFVEIMKQSFCEDAFIYLKQVYNITFTVPLGVEIKLGTHWGTGEEFKYNLDPEELYWLDAV